MQVRKESLWRQLLGVTYLRADRGHRPGEGQLSIGSRRPPGVVRSGLSTATLSKELTAL